MENITIDDLRKITDIYIDWYGKCKEFLISCIYFENPNDNDAQKILNNWPFFRAVNYCFEQTLIIELCKLFQENNNTQQYNIHKFVNILVNNYKSLEYKDKLSLSIIKGWSDRLNCEEANCNIEYIVTLRDNIYAHTDKIDRYFQDNEKIIFSKIEYLLLIIEYILVSIYANVYDCDLLLDRNINILDFESIIRMVLERNRYLKKFGNIND